MRKRTQGVYRGGWRIDGPVLGLIVETMREERVNVGKQLFKTDKEWHL